MLTAGLTVIVLPPFYSQLMSQGVEYSAIQCTVLIPLITVIKP